MAKMAHADQAEMTSYVDRLLVEAMAVIDDLSGRLGMTEAEVRKLLPEGLHEYYKPPALALPPKAEGDGEAALAKLDKLIGGVVAF